MPNPQETLLVRNVTEVFNERDEAKRLSIMQELYDPDAVFYETNDAIFRGIEKVNARVTDVLKTISPELLFRASGLQEQNNDVVRVPWILSGPDGKVALSGMDIAKVEDGKIASLYMFIDGPR